MKYIVIILLCLLGVSQLVQISASPKSDNNKAATDMVTGSFTPDFGKPGAPVSISYDVPKELELGQQSTVVIRLTSSVNDADMTVKMNSDAGLSIIGDHSYTFRLDGSEKIIAMEVLANENGLHYVNLQVEIDDTTSKLQSNIRVFSVPVQVGKSLKLKQKTTVIESNGEKIIEMISQ